jgi:hypothetical protein
MPLDQLSAFGFVVVVAGAFVAATLFERRRMRRLCEQLRGDPDVEAVYDGGIRPTVFVRTRANRRSARLSFCDSTESQQGLHREFRSEAPRVWRRTTLKMIAAGAGRTRLGALRGLNAPTGDSALEARVALGGAQPDVVRGLFRVPAVRDAAIALVDQFGIDSLTIDDRGEVACLLNYGKLDAHDAKKTLLALVEFIDILEAAADAPELPAPGSAPKVLEAVGGASGAPVGVPGAVLDRRS